MKRILQLFKVYFSQYLLLLCFFTLLRIGFALFNLSYFGGVAEVSFFSLLWNGLRFDISAISILTIPFGLIILVAPYIFKSNRLYKWVLWLPVIVAMLFDIGDWLYFPFNHKRSTAEVLTLFGANSDFFQLLPSFFREFYYIFILAAFIISAYVFISNKLLNANPLRSILRSKNVGFRFLNNMIYLVLFTGVSLLGVRGGLQLVPINVRNAVEVVDAKFAPVVLNTPFSIIHTMANMHLDPLDWLDVLEVDDLAPTMHEAFGTQEDFQHENVMIVVMESFSKDFTKLSTHGESYTPFLDSLMDHSELYINTYANGLHSAEGIPAILASMPSWMSENFTASMYGSNKIQGIAGLLGLEGYSSAFFHGAHNGSMGFDVFSKNAGFQKYIGKDEYPNQKEDYDGAWGIYDKPFFEFSLNEINNMPQPFVNCLFSLSSHSPYSLPAADEKRLKTEDFPVYGTVKYADEALRDFFENAKKEDWYENTWFVITTDHTSPMNKHSEALQGFEKYEIPFLLFHPQKTKEGMVIEEVVSHIDMMPLIFEKLKYPRPYFAFGHHDLSNGLGMMAELNNQFYVLSRNGCGMILNALKDDINKVDFIASCGEADEKKMFWKLYQAYRQQYNHVLITNAVPSL